MSVELRNRDRKLFPNLMSEYADLAAVPLTDIFNTISETLIWPTVWKIEIVTVIPKCADPSSFDQLRNISCTLFVCLFGVRVPPEYTGGRESVLYSTEFSI